MSKILIIDDDAAVLELMIGILEEKGHEVVSAQDARQGLATLAKQQPDVVIIDILMPEMDGLETIRAIVALAAHPKIIAISGGGQYNDVPYLDYATTFGADTTLAKPFHAAEPTAAVNNVLAQLRH